MPDEPSLEELGLSDGDDENQSSARAASLCALCGEPVKQNQKECEACQEIRRTSSTPTRKKQTFSTIPPQQDKSFVGLPAGVVVALIAFIVMLLGILGWLFRLEDMGRAEQVPSMTTLTEVARRSDAAGDVMILLVENGEYSEQELKAYCRYIKRNPPGGRFAFVVVFDEVEKAVFPKNPFTALYGLEFSVIKHVRATYEFNAVNGYSQLTLFSSNMYEGTPLFFTIQ